MNWQGQKVSRRGRAQQESNGDADLLRVLVKSEILRWPWVVQSDVVHGRIANVLKRELHGEISPRRVDIHMRRGRHNLWQEMHGINIQMITAAGQDAACMRGETNGKTGEESGCAAERYLLANQQISIFVGRDRSDEK